MLFAATLLLLLFLIRGCDYWFWGEGDIDRTLTTFRQHRPSFDSFVTWAEQKTTRTCIQKSSVKSCLPKSIDPVLVQSLPFVSYDPLIVEVAPVNFYYVLVYTEDIRHVKQSSAYQDEGIILQQVESRWTLVRRGWM